MHAVCRSQTTQDIYACSDIPCSCVCLPFQTVDSSCMWIRDKLAAAEKRLESMTAIMRAANPLTPFDFLTTAACIDSSDPGQDDANAHQEPYPTSMQMQPIPAVQLAQFRDVEVVVSRRALGGWVEQTSPACGAASVAGAWNAVKPEGTPLSTSLGHSFVSQRQGWGQPAAHKCCELMLGRSEKTLCFYQA